MPKGYLLLVLHAHLPYIRHPEYDRFLEERWFFEAVTETYIPLVKFFDRLRDEGTPFKLTLSVSPTLANMMEDPLLRAALRPPPGHADPPGRVRVRADAALARRQFPRPNVSNSCSRRPGTPSSSAAAPGWFPPSASTPRPAGWN